jgi:glycosyltransferase involved in cell wall biosynthesis
MYMSAPPVSVTIITLNEEKNLPRAIRSVGWADEVLVVDSGSTDRTVESARELGATVLSNAWKGYGQQKNCAQAHVRNDWVLSIDADEEVSPDLQREIQQALSATANGSSQARGFYFPRKTFYLGRWIRHGGWYPNHLVRLADRRHARWTEPAVHETLAVDGQVTGILADLHHFTFSGIQDQILTNLNFSRLGYVELLRKGQRPNLFKLVFKPIGKFIETYFLKRGFLDGLPGFIISVNAAHSMFLKYAYLFEAELQNDANSRHR